MDGTCLRLYDFTEIQFCPRCMPNISFAGAKKRKTRHSSYTFKMARHTPGITQLGLAQSGLLSLVDELLLNIIDQIDAHETLCHLAATCMRFQGLVEPYIWRSLLVLTGAHARRIATALDSREERVDYVHELSIRYKDDYRDGIEELNHFLGLMSRLRRLTIETPCPNNSEWRSGVYFDGWSRIDYTNLLASAVYPRLEMPLALPMLQSRKDRTLYLRRHAYIRQSRCMAMVQATTSSCWVAQQQCFDILLSAASRYRA